jgi:hypothetical protein
MVNEESHLALIEANHKSTTSTDYVKVVEYTVKPDRLAKINTIVFGVDSAGLGKSYFRLLVGGEVKFNDLMLTSSNQVTLNFGGHLKLRPATDEGIRLFVRSDGTAIVAMGVISGIEVLR